MSVLFVLSWSFILRSVLICYVMFAVNVSKELILDISILSYCLHFNFGRRKWPYLKDDEMYQTLVDNNNEDLAENGDTVSTLLFF